MADQRRYTQEQYNRVAASGEEVNPDMSTAGRIARNMGVAIPRTATGIVQTLGFIGPAIQAGLSSDVDLGEAMYGEEGLKALGDFKDQEFSKVWSTLPPERQTQANKDALESGIEGSDAFQELALQYSPTLFRWGMEGANAINETAGLGKVWNETGADEAIQAATTALIPINKITGPINAISNVAIRSALRTGELLLPGSSGSVASISGNALADIGASQAMRAVSGAPSLITQDHDLAEKIAAKKQAAASTGVTADPTQQLIVKSSQSTAVAPEDQDPEDGFLSKHWASLAAGAAVVVAGAAAFRGRAIPGLAPSVTDAIDTHVAPVRPTPGVTPQADLAETMTPGQTRVTQTLDEQAPLEQKAKEAIDSNTVLNTQQKQTAFETMTQLRFNAQPGEIDSAVNRWYKTGMLPGLSSRVPSGKDIDTAFSRLAPDEQQLYMDGMELKDLFNRKRSTDTEMLKQVNQAQIDAHNPHHPMTISQYAAKRAEYNAFMSPGHQIRDGLDMTQARALVAQFDANPKLVAIKNLYRRVDEGILQSKLNLGVADNATIARVMGHNADHVFRMEDPLAGSKGLQRSLASFKSKFAGRSKQTMYSQKRSSIQATGDAKWGVISDVKNSVDANTALRAYVADHIRFVRTNAAAQHWTDAVMGSPQAGKMARAVTRPVSISDFNRGSPEIRNALGLQNAYVVSRNGTVQVFEAADRAVANAMNFNPASAATGFDYLRRMTQFWATGPGNPAFAVKSALYDAIGGWMGKQPGEAYGLIDSMLRKTFPNADWLQAVLDKNPGLPVTMLPHMLYTATSGISRKFIAAVSQKLVDDLTHNSGFWNMMVQGPGGRAFAQRVAEHGVRQYRESIFGLAEDLGISGTRYNDRPYEVLDTGFRSGLQKLGVSGMGRAVLQGYTATLESIRSAAAVAHLSQNLAVLAAKHPGGIPVDAMRKLANRSRTLAGDMTKHPGSEGFAKVVSGVPYAQTAMNSSQFVVKMMKADPMGVGSKLLLGVFAPAATGAYIMSLNEDTYDWYFNKTRNSDRVKSIVMPKPESLVKFLAGEQPAMGPDDYTLLALPQELALINSVFMSMLRATGAFENTKAGAMDRDHQAPGKEIGLAIENMMPLQTPAAFTMLLGRQIDVGQSFTGWLTGGSAIKDEYQNTALGLNAPDEYTRTVTDGIHALMGTAADIIDMTVSSAVSNISQGEDFVTTVKEAFQWAGYGVESKVTNVLGSNESLFGTRGRENKYATTAQRERVVETANQIAELIGQRGTEKSNIGEKPLDGVPMKLPEVNNPMAEELMQYIASNLNRGKFLQSRKLRGEVNDDLATLEYYKEEFSPETYHKQKSVLYDKLHSYDQQMEDEIERVNTNLGFKYKDMDMDIDKAMGLIKSSLVRPTR